MGIGDRIKKARKNLDLTQNELALKANISRSYLADVENNRYNPSFSTLEKIAEALTVSVDRLIGESASSIIEDRLDELELTLEDVAKKTGVSLYWLQNLDTFIPGEFGRDNDISYKWISQVAKALGIQPSILRAALARQEIPVYNGYVPDPKEAFEDFVVCEKAAEYEEVFDEEIRAIARNMKNLSPDKRKLLGELVKSMSEEGDKALE